MKKLLFAIIILGSSCFGLFSSPKITRMYQSPRGFYITVHHPGTPKLNYCHLHEHRLISMSDSNITYAKKGAPIYATDARHYEPTGRVTLLRMNLPSEYAKLNMITSIEAGRFSIKCA